MSSPVSLGSSLSSLVLGSCVNSVWGPLHPVVLTWVSVITVVQPLTPTPCPKSLQPISKASEVQPPLGSPSFYCAEWALLHRGWAGCGSPEA
jgi:hypothetical protein